MIWLVCSSFCLCGLPHCYLELLLSLCYFAFKRIKCSPCYTSHYFFLHHNTVGHLPHVKERENPSTNRPCPFSSNDISIVFNWGSLHNSVHKGGRGQVHPLVAAWLCFWNWVPFDQCWGAFWAGFPLLSVNAMPNDKDALWHSTLLAFNNKHFLHLKLLLYMNRF